MNVNGKYFAGACVGCICAAVALVWCSADQYALRSWVLADSSRLTIYRELAYDPIPIVSCKARLRDGAVIEVDIGYTDPDVWRCDELELVECKGVMGEEGIAAVVCRGEQNVVLFLLAPHSGLHWPTAGRLEDLEMARFLLSRLRFENSNQEWIVSSNATTFGKIR